MGGYAQVTGYSYATPPCTQGSCANQDLSKLAEAIERTPVSICVNAGTWNDYTGGVLTSAACGPMGAMYQDHLEMAKNTCGLADDATIPDVKLDLSEKDLAEAAVRREQMYQAATAPFASATQPIVI